MSAVRVASVASRRGLSPTTSLQRMSVLHRVLCLTAAILLGGCASAGPPAADSAAAPPITTARELLGAMHARHSGSWFTTLSFLQNNTLYSAAGGEQKTQWLEHISLPGRLRIDYMPLANHSGVLYEGGRVHVFDNGRRVQSQPDVNALLLLGFDVFAQPVGQTSATLEALGFDLGLIHEAEWEGRGAYVVGAARGDTTVNQFWIDAERLLFVRMMQQNPARTVLTEYRFNRYTEFDGFPVAVEVLMLRNGRVFFREEYANVRVNVAIPPEVFNPARWVEAQPVPKP